MLRDTKRVWEAERRKKYATRISQAPRLPSSSARPAKGKTVLKAKVSLAKRREFSAAGSAKLKEEREAGESPFQIWRSGKDEPSQHGFNPKIISERGAKQRAHLDCGTS
jgi:hypothetical protein